MSKYTRAYDYCMERYSAYGDDNPLVAAKCIKKQIAEPVRKKKRTGQRLFGECPTCGNKVTGRLHYCSDCGQRLDWGDIENEIYR